MLNKLSVWFSFGRVTSFNVILSPQALEKQYYPQNYDIQSLKRFKFATNTSSDRPCVGISFERRIVGEWNLGLENSNKVRMSTSTYSTN